MNHKEKRLLDSISFYSEDEDKGESSLNTALLACIFAESTLLARSHLQSPAIIQPYRLTQFFLYQFLKVKPS